MYTLGAPLLVFFAVYTFTGVFFPVYTFTLEFVSRYAGRTVIGILPRETPDTLTLPQLCLQMNLIKDVSRPRDVKCQTQGVYLRGHSTTATSEYHESGGTHDSNSLVQGNDYR